METSRGGGGTCSKAAKVACSLAPGRGESHGGNRRCVSWGSTASCSHGVGYPILLRTCFRTKPWPTRRKDAPPLTDVGLLLQKERVYYLRRLARLGLQKQNLSASATMQPCLAVGHGRDAGASVRCVVELSGAQSWADSCLLFRVSGDDVP